jgi:hypothetical protein
MSGWQPIDTAPRETGRPLLLYPYPYPRGKALHSPQPSDRPMLHVNDPAVRRFIKHAKKWGYVTSDELNEIMPPEVFSPEQVKDAIRQLAEMGINVVEGEKALWGQEDQPGDAAEREGAPDDQPEAPATSASASEGHFVVYSSVCEGYWDGNRWRSAGGVPCEPTHWMPLPSPPLALVGQ